jgi:hypothetical protein
VAATGEQRSPAVRRAELCKILGSRGIKPYLNRLSSPAAALRTASAKAQFTCNPVGGGAVVGRTEAVRAERREPGHVGVEPLSVEKIFCGLSLSRHHGRHHPDQNAPSQHGCLLRLAVTQTPPDHAGHFGSIVGRGLPEIRSPGRRFIVPRPDRPKLYEFRYALTSIPTAARCAGNGGRARTFPLRLAHDPEKWVPVFPRDKRGTRLRGDHAQIRR